MTEEKPKPTITALHKSGDPVTAVALANFNPDVNNEYSFAPNVFVDGIQGFAIQDQIVRLNWVQDRMGISKLGEPILERPLERFVAIRMSMTIQQFVRVQEWMAAVVEDLKKQGAIVVPQPPKTGE